MQQIRVEQSGAFIAQFSLPPTGDGPLAGLRFAVKDIIDVAGYPTGCGNPTWLATHPVPTVSAVCVEQLLAAGGHCVGKTITDEFALSLIGENYFYGTPLNPAAPDRVPGGSSSGSASAVACGLADFALGTDTGGSVRIPASNCGIWGWRPTYGAISVAGVMPLAPSLDTVGVLAGSIEVLQRAAAVLLAGEPPRLVPPTAIHLIPEAFALADPEIQRVLDAAMDSIQRKFGDAVRETSLADLCGTPSAADLATWLDAYRRIQAAETGSVLNAWIADAQPAVGPAVQAGFRFIRGQDRARVGDALRRRELYSRSLRRTLGERALLCIPTAPTIAPLKGKTSYDRTSDYYQQTLSLTSIAGIGGLPQVSIPLPTTDSAPIGLSLIGASTQDLFLLQVASIIGASLYEE